MSSLEPILWERLSLHSHWRVPTSRGSQQAAAVPERPLESQGSQRCPCPRYHPPPQGPNEARPQVLPPQFFTLYYALLESMSHCLGRAARSLPSQELNFQCVQWPHSYILESISTCSLHVILKAKKHAHSWYSVFLIWNFGLHIGPYIFINLLIQRKGNLRTATAKSLQSCPTLCDPIDGSQPGAPVPGILQARTLEWVAISFSNV